MDNNTIENNASSSAGLERQIDQIVADFLQAVQRKNLATCQELLIHLTDLVVPYPTYKPWPDYLRGILANEADKDFSTAERIFQRLLTTPLPPNLHGRILIALGVSYRRQGRWQEALTTYQTALDVYHHPQQGLERAKLWKNMAIALEIGYVNGQFSDTVLSQGIDYCQLALATLEAYQPPDESIQWLIASIWGTLGVIYYSLGEGQTAIDCYQRRIALDEEIDNVYGIGMASNNIGEVLHQQGATHWPAAEVAYQRALTIYRQKDVSYEMVDALVNLAKLYQDKGDWQTALTYYAEAITTIETLRAGLSSEQGRVTYFGTVTNTYANAILLCLQHNQQERAFNYVERARARAFLDIVGSGSITLAPHVTTDPVTLKEVQLNLAPHSLLLAYYTTGFIAAEAGRGQPPRRQRHRFPPATTHLFAVTKDKIRVYPIDLSPNDLHPGTLNRITETHFLEPAMRQVLYRRLISPVAPWLKDTQQIYIAPHGLLHYIPFQALIAPDGDTFLRRDGPAITYTPSASLLCQMMLSYPQAITRQSVLAVGYNSQGATQLQFASQEADQIARLMGGDAWLGATTSKEKLLAQVNHYQYLHLACHAEFNLDEPLQSRLHLAPNEFLTMGDILNHLDLCADVVTLSACESGLHQIMDGDELFGLVRALLYAGAQSVVASLWRVDDESALWLMTRFYTYLKEGEPLDHALKLAQLDLKEGKLLNEKSEDKPRDFSDPYHWAAFIMVGRIPFN